MDKIQNKPLNKGNIQLLKILVKNCFPIDYSEDLY